MILFLEIFFGINIIVIFFGWVFSGPRYEGPVTDHFNGKTFINPGNVKAKGFKDVLKWMFFRKQGAWPIQTHFFIGEPPVKEVTHGIRVTFVNHSTFLIQFDGLNLLTDPVWSKRVSPFEWIGPKRKRPPGIKLEDLPKIDAVLISHNHWDHLDIKTIIKLNDRHHPKFFVPLGVDRFLKKHGINSEATLDWWQEVRFEQATIQAVPAQHFSGRGIFDRDATLWVGYNIIRPDGNIYFCGDTGYNPITFLEIGKRCSPIELAIIPIGAYMPTWFMSPIHCSPEEAVKIHLETKSKKSVATHFGTFQLADDGKDDPVNDLKQALEESGTGADKFVALEEGVPADF